MSHTPALTSRCDAALAPRLEQRILPGLERMHTVLAAVGHPERAFRPALVVGTNGKGSTAALLAGILSRHGTRVGLYTSPHLVRVEERLRIGGEPVEPDRLLALISDLARFPQLSYFETLTVAAFRHFAESGVEVAVLEAGLGGRWDATNAAEPEVAMLTNVGTDHQAWLGTTRGEIAAEKGAALRGREAIVGAWDDEVSPVIRAAADPATPLSLASDWASARVVSGQWSVDSALTHRAAGERRSDHRPLATDHVFPLVSFDAAGIRGSATLPLRGDHQIANLTLALAGAAALAKHGIVPPLRAEAVVAGIEGTDWPGRLQWVQWHGLPLLLDGAHNREAMTALAAALDRLGLSGRVNLLFSCLDDKPLAAMAAALRPRVCEVLVTPLSSPRATGVSDLAAAFPGCTPCADVTEGLARIPTGAPTLVTGSLRLVGEVLALVGAAGG